MHAIYTVVQKITYIHKIESKHSEMGPVRHTQSWAKAYLHTKWHLDPCSHLPTTDMGRKLGDVPLWGGGAGPHLTQCVRGRDLPLYLHDKFHLDPSNRLATVHQRYTDRTDRQTIAPIA